MLPHQYITAPGRRQARRHPGTPRCPLAPEEATHQLSCDGPTRS